MKLISEFPFLTPDRMIRMYQFENGLKAILLRDTSAPVLAYQTWFKVGSRHEKRGTTGIAHLFEHLMFNETEHLRPGEFDRLIEMQGGHTNAATWVDWTYYQNDLPASELEMITRLEADRMSHLVLRSPQLESEREVVMNERRFRVEDDVDGFLSEQLFRLAFEYHPYHWPTIGFMEDIKAISLVDAQSFYRTYYAPNNATLVIVGDIEEAKALSYIQKYYGHLKSQIIPQESFLNEPVQTTERRATYKKPVTTTRLLLGYKAPGCGDAKFVALQMLADLLLGSPSSRLYRDLVIENEIASSAQAFTTPFRDPGLFQIRVALQRGRQVEEVEERISYHLRFIQERGPSQEEVDRTVARFLTGFLSGLRTTHGKAEALGENETTLSDYRELFTTIERVQKVTPSDLQNVAQEFLHPQHRTVVVAVPESSQE